MNTTIGRRNGHERRDVDVAALLLIILGLLISGALIHLVVAIMLHFFQVHEPGKTSGAANIPTTQTSEFPPPGLIIRPGADLAALRAAEESDLTTYGWIDRSKGAVRIPIDRAMQLLVERGLPESGAGQTPLSLMKARPNESATPPRSMQKP